jgi:thiopeptide-type bacteriocin biosynthesis protein
MWQSFHVYYEEVDELLSDCVSPMVLSLRSQGLIERFFFLRYWTRGFHVRLRFLAHDERSMRVIQDEVVRRIQEYMDRDPSTRRVDEQAYAEMQLKHAALERIDAGTLELVANNSITIERYEPEYNKYGGPLGVKIAENVFDRSAACVLSVLPTLNARDGRRLGVAFTMMLLALRQFGVPTEQMPAFLRRYAAVWRDYVLIPLSQISGWRSAELRKQLQRHACAVLAGPVPQQTALQTWADAVTAAAQTLREQENAVLPFVTIAGEDYEPDARRSWLLAQYVHTHNNRLGIGPADEAYLGILGADALEAAK